MSDTPIDRNLTDRKSTRYPDFMNAQVGEFRSQYNEMIRGSEMSEERTEQFLLDSESDTRRRLVDMGLAMWAADNIPYGFALDPDSWGSEDESPECPECGEDEPMRLRVAATPEASDGGETPFETVRCLSCEGATHISEVFDQPTPLF